MPIAGKPTTSVNPKNFLTKVDGGKKIIKAQKKQIIFSQGDAADAVFYILEGKVKLTVVSQKGKEAVLAILGCENFFGEGCLTAQRVRMATATSLENTTMVRIEKAAMVRVLNEDLIFSGLFMSHLLSHNIRIEEDLVDQLASPSVSSFGRSANVKRSDI